MKMTMKGNKCLYCYKPLEEGAVMEYHEKCSQEFFGMIQPPKLAYSLTQMDELAQNIIKRSIAVPGVQPKISLSVIADSLKKGITGRFTVALCLAGEYIFKPPSLIYKEMPANEHVTMRMAGAFGINTLKSSLIRLKSGELSYITRQTVTMVTLLSA